MELVKKYLKTALAIVTAIGFAAGVIIEAITGIIEKL